MFKKKNSSVRVTGRNTHTHLTLNSNEWQRVQFRNVVILHNPVKNLEIPGGKKKSYNCQDLIMMELHHSHSSRSFLSFFFLKDKTNVTIDAEHPGGWWVTEMCFDDTSTTTRGAMVSRTVWLYNCMLCQHCPHTRVYLFSNPLPPPPCVTTHQASVTASALSLNAYS